MFVLPVLLVLAAAPEAPSLRPSVQVSFGTTSLGGVEAGVDFGFVRIEGGAAWTWSALSRGPGELTAYARGGVRFELFDKPTAYGVHVRGELSPLLEARFMNAFNRTSDYCPFAGPCQYATPQWDARPYLGGGAELRWSFPVRERFAFTASVLAGLLVNPSAVPDKVIEAQTGFGVAF